MYTFLITQVFGQLMVERIYQRVYQA